MIELHGDPVRIEIERADKLASFYTLSPYVLPIAEGFAVLLRLVNRSDDAEEKVSRVHAGTSRDGTTFVLGGTPVLEPDDMMEDSGGCEDPTVAVADGQYVVFYSGYSRKTRASYMLGATGSKLERLTKHGLVFADPAYQNPKEAAVASTSTGYRMFVEYAADGRSKIGVADAPAIGGPWTFAPTPLEARAGRFDAYHMSPASTVRLNDGRVVLFYNGSAQTIAWRIGWAILNSDATKILERSDEPLISPQDIEDGDTDIAFAASTVVVEPNVVWMYYSVSDRILKRRTIYVPGARSDASGGGKVAVRL